MCIADLCKCSRYNLIIETILSDFTSMLGTRVYGYFKSIRSQ